MLGHDVLPFFKCYIEKAIHMPAKINRSGLYQFRYFKIQET